MFTFLLGTALGAEPEVGNETAPAEVTEPAMMKEGLEVLQRRVPRYPASELKNKVSMTCEVEVVVGTDGTVTSATSTAHEECTQPFAESAEATISQWRWKPVVEDGSPVPFRTKIRTVFVGTDKATGSLIQKLSKAELDTIREAHVTSEEGRDRTAPCVLTATAHASGDVSGLSTNDPVFCMAVPVGGAVAKKKVWASLGESAGTCQVRFTPLRDSITAFGVEDCPEELQKPSLALLKRWAFNEMDGVPYEMALTFTNTKP